MSDRRVSKEELEAFWRGDKNTYQRMYSQRMQQKANEAEKQGKQVTYIPNDGSATLPEVSVTAPKETEEQKNLRLKQDYESFTDNAITAAGFIPGLDTFSDIADIGNSWRKDDYSGMLWGLAGLGLPVSGKALKSGWNWFKNLPNIRNYRAARKISSDIDDGRKFAERRDEKYLKNQEWDPTRYLSYSRIGKPETDSETFYHYMNVPFGQPVTARSGQVRLQNNTINPVSGHKGQKGRIWWNKGSLPSGNPSILITSKSNLINERVVDHPEKYSIHYGLYEPTYYTSGPIPLKDIQIYEKNPFTGHYDSDKLITQEYPTINIQDNLFNPKRWFEELGNRKYYEGDNAYTFNDITTLQKHLPEYYNYQFFNKYNDPNYMKSFPLDESAYLMLQSKAIKTNYNPELIYSGIEESIDPNYNGILWGVRGQGLVPAYKARAYTTSDKGVMPILYDKNTKIVNTDMQGKSWYKLSYNGNTVRTNDIVDDLFNKGNDIVQMDNVLDPGPNLIPSNSKYQLFKDRLDQLTMGMFPQNNVILKPGVIRKSLLGNNGNFDKFNLNLYRKKGGKL